MKRFFAWLLVAFLICSLLPAAGIAEESAWWENDYWETDTLLMLGAVIVINILMEKTA